jgi:hypothetical protein
MHFADLVNHPGVEQNPLSQSRLARINVRANADIPRAIQRILAIRTVGIGRHETDENFPG